MKWKFRMFSQFYVMSRYKRFRSKLVLFWVAGNFIYAGGILLFNATAVYGVILTIIIGVLFGYRFVGSITYQIIKLCKYYQKYHSTSGRRHLFQTAASNPLHLKTNPYSVFIEHFIPQTSRSGGRTACNFGNELGRYGK